MLSSLSGQPLLVLKLLTTTAILSGLQGLVKLLRNPPLPTTIDLVLLHLFRPNLVALCAEPRNEHSKARTPGPTEAYTIWYVAGSALGASNTARRS